MIRGKIERQNSYPSINIIEFFSPTMTVFFFFPGGMWTPFWVWDLNPVGRLVLPRIAMLLLDIEASLAWHVSFYTRRVHCQAGILVILLHQQPSWSPLALWNTVNREGVSQSVQLNFFTSYLQLMHMTGLRNRALSSSLWYAGILRSDRLYDMWGLRSFPGQQLACIPLALRLSFSNFMSSGGFFLQPYSVL